MYEDFNYHEYKNRISNLPKLKQIEPTLEFSHSKYFIPSNPWNKLYKFQKEGLKWLFSLEDQLIGGILGDEMGLGKTIQIVVFLYSLLYSSLINEQTSNFKPHLIVCPATILFQWHQTFLKWAPHLRVLTLYRNADKIQVDVFRKILSTAPGIVVITSYGHLRSYSQFLLDIDWHFVVFDEGHIIRNHANKISQVSREIKASNKLLSTGTPLQNNLTEFWSLIDFTNPGLLGDLEDFQCNFEIPISHGGYNNSTKFQVIEAYRAATTLRNIIKPFILRRLKIDVVSELELPAKKEHILFVSPSDKQKELYREFINSKDCQKILEKRLNQLVGINKLRQICNHPFIYHRCKFSIEDNARELLLDENLDFSTTFNEDIDDIPINDFNWKESGKLLILKSLLDEWLNDDNSSVPNKILIFSQSILMLDLIGSFLSNIFGVRFLRIDGSTNTMKRQHIISEFEQDPRIPIFLLSTRVGGTGLNLICANRVIIFDPDWNPSVDNQARERSWRIGQSKEVIIYRLITAGTIEEKIFKRQEFKQHIATKVLSNPKQKRISSHDFELADLFSYDFTSLKPEENNLFNEVKGAIADQDSNEPKRKKYECLAIRLSKMISSNDEENDKNSFNDQESSKNEKNCANERNESSEDELFGDTFKKINVHRFEKNAKKNNESDDPNLLVYEAKNRAKEIIEHWKKTKNINQPMNSKNSKFFNNSTDKPQSSSIKKRLLINRAKVSGQVLSVKESEANSKLVNDLLEFFRSKNKKCKTSEILDRFSEELKLIDSKIFKEILRTIADFDKNTKLWSLSKAYI